MSIPSGRPVSRLSVALIVVVFLCLMPGVAHGEDVSIAVGAPGSVAVGDEVDVKAIVTSTLSGYTARQIARHRPIRRIVAVSPSAATQRRLALVWGVDCLISGGLYQDTDAMLEDTAQTVRQVGFQPGDRVVITAGIPFGQSGQTNVLKVHEIEP